MPYPYVSLVISVYTARDPHFILLSSPGSARPNPAPLATFSAPRRTKTEQWDPGVVVRWVDIKNFELSWETVVAVLLTISIPVRVPELQFLVPLKGIQGSNRDRV